MQMFSRRFLGQAAGGAALVLLFVPPVAAQTAGGLDPYRLDVAGVKLGMTPNDAIAALKKFEPKYVIAKRYFEKPQFMFGNTEGKDIKDIDDKRVAYFASLAAEKDEQKKICSIRPPYGCYTEPHAVETVTVWFSPVPGQERVIAVQRKAPFEKDPLPAVVSLKSSIFAKYPKDQATYENQDASGYSVEWAFDAQKRIRPASAGKRRSYSPSRGGLPNQVNEGDGFGLSVMFGSTNQAVGLAGNMSVSLYDGNALYKSVAQAQATYKTLKAKADTAEVDRSKGKSQPKF